MSIRITTVRHAGIRVRRRAGRVRTRSACDYCAGDGGGASARLSDFREYRRRRAPERPSSHCRQTFRSPHRSRSRNRFRRARDNSISRNAGKTTPEPLANGPFWPRSSRRRVVCGRRSTGVYTDEGDVREPAIKNRPAKRKNSAQNGARRSAYTAYVSRRGFPSDLMRTMSRRVARHGQPGR